MCGFFLLESSYILTLADVIRCVYTFNIKQFILYLQLCMHTFILALITCISALILVVSFAVKQQQYSNSYFTKTRRVFTSVQTDSEHLSELKCQQHIPKYDTTFQPFKEFRLPTTLVQILHHPHPNSFINIPFCQKFNNSKIFTYTSQFL